MTGRRVVTRKSGIHLCNVAAASRLCDIAGVGSTAIRYGHLPRLCIIDRCVRTTSRDAVRISTAVLCFIGL